jgi:hypothetical protein
MVCQTCINPTPATKCNVIYSPQYLTIQMKTLMAIQFRVCNEVGLVLHHLSIKSRYKQTVVYEVPISGREFAL